MLSSTPGRPIRRFLLLACLAGVAASFMLASVASAAPIPTNVKLSQSAQFTLSYQIDVQVALSCTAGIISSGVPAVLTTSVMLRAGLPEDRWNWPCAR